MNAHSPERAHSCYTSEMARKRRKPGCIVIAGPNGAGKTTFARDYLPAIAGLIHFVNVDLIAGGISPLRPELAAVTAGRVVLRELDRPTPVNRRNGWSKVHDY
jgi:ABC-type cobalamin/Fe3+-siderophores transport system ATPase subunit